MIKNILDGFAVICAGALVVSGVVSILCISAKVAIMACGVWF